MRWKTSFLESLDSIFPASGGVSSWAEQYGRILADVTARGVTIGGNDMLIAAIALANGCTLVTHNTAEFSRVPDLVIADRQVP
jgi:tRNA(fMet)-specific endonuclease VapC